MSIPSSSPSPHGVAISTEPGPFLPPATIHSEPAGAAEGTAQGSLNDMLAALLACSFESHGFSTREEVASMTREDVDRVCAAAQPDLISMIMKSNLVDRMLPDFVAAGNVQHCRVILEAKADPDVRNLQGQTPLMLAASKGHEECLTCLLNAQADVLACSPDGRTALHAACATARERCAILLIAAGASLFSRAVDGSQPLYLLSRSGHRAIPSQYGGAASQGPPYPSDPEPWRRRELQSEGFKGNILEAKAVRLARGARLRIAFSLERFEK
ncbi:MAG: hypothetical protein SGPRY_001799 [Prymnesium sp.]